MITRTFTRKSRRGPAASVCACTCDTCGAEFERLTSQIVGLRTYCNNPCVPHPSTRKRTASIEARFWLKVNKSHGLGPQGECWEWTGRRTSDGYGRIGYEGRNPGAHKVSWILHNGPVPDGKNVLHRCDNPPCVRPDHLFIGTQKENIADCISKGRFRSKLTPEQAAEIRTRYAAGGTTYSKLATEYGIRRTSMWAIIKGQAAQASRETQE